MQARFELRRPRRMRWHAGAERDAVTQGEQPLFSWLFLRNGTFTTNAARIDPRHSGAPRPIPSPSLAQAPAENGVIAMHIDPRRAQPMNEPRRPFNPGKEDDPGEEGKEELSAKRKSGRSGHTRASN